MRNTGIDQSNPMTSLLWLTAIAYFFGQRQLEELDDRVA
jgi:hypothetical protein